MIMRLKPWKRFPEDPLLDRRDWDHRRRIASRMDKRHEGRERGAHGAVDCSTSSSEHEDFSRGMAEWDDEGLANFGLCMSI